MNGVDQLATPDRLAPLIHPNDADQAFVAGVQFARALILSQALLTLATSSALADQNCRGRVISPIAGDAPAAVGEVISYLNLASINDDGSARSYSLHGGIDFPAAGIKLLNCHLEKIKSSDGLGFTFSLILDNTPANSSEIIRSTVERKLSDAGLDNSNAADAADAYVKRPETACGRAARMILGGNSEMVSVVMTGGICRGVDQQAV